MADRYESIGKGGIWINTSKNGVKYMAGEITFSYNGHEVTTKFVAFKAKEKTGRQPDYVVTVNDAAPAKAREPKSQEFKAKPGEYSGKEEDSDSVPF